MLYAFAFPSRLHWDRFLPVDPVTGDNGAVTPRGAPASNLHTSRPRFATGALNPVMKVDVWEYSLVPGYLVPGGRQMTRQYCSLARCKIHNLEIAARFRLPIRLSSYLQKRAVFRLRVMPGISTLNTASAWKYRSHIQFVCFSLTFAIRAALCRRSVGIRPSSARYAVAGSTAPNECV